MINQRKFDDIMIQNEATDQNYDFLGWKFIYKHFEESIDENPDEWIFELNSLGAQIDDASFHPINDKRFLACNRSMLQKNETHPWWSTV